jgi:hypothetical protein
MRTDRTDNPTMWGGEHFHENVTGSKKRRKRTEAGSTIRKRTGAGSKRTSPRKKSGKSGAPAWDIAPHKFT